MPWFGELHFGFEVILALVLLVMLYAISLINRAMRLLQYKMEGMEKDLQLVSEELKMLALRKEPAADLSDWAKQEGLRPGPDNQTGRE